MIEDLKQVRDALGAIRNCYRTHSTISSGVWECKIKPSLATLDRIIAEQTPAQPVQDIPEGLRTLDWKRDIAILKAEFKDEIAAQRLDRLGKLIGYLSKGIE